MAAEKQAAKSLSVLLLPGLLAQAVALAPSQGATALGSVVAPLQLPQCCCSSRSSAPWNHLSADRILKKSARRRRGTERRVTGRERGAVQSEGADGTRGLFGGLVIVGAVDERNVQLSASLSSVFFSAHASSTLIVSFVPLLVALVWYIEGRGRVGGGRGV